MRALRTFCVWTLLVSVSVTGMTACYGNFNLTRKLHAWNGTIGSDVANTAVMWILFIVPVYSVVGFVDFAILNVIEFWTGENPVKLAEGEVQEQIVERDGVAYTVRATHNRFDITPLAGGQTVSLVFDDTSGTWLVEQNDQRVPIARHNLDNPALLDLIHPYQHTVQVDLSRAN